MIETIKLENFKSHRATQLTLDDSRLHALVGQNSSGKTSVLEAIYSLGGLGDGPSDLTGIDEELPQFMATVGQETMSITLEGFQNGLNKTAWKLSHSYKYMHSKWFPNPSWKIEESEPELSDIKPIEYEKYGFEHTVYLKLVVSNLHQAAYSDEVTPRLKYDGSGLAPTLDFIRSESPSKFEELKVMLKQIVPGVKDIGIKRAKVTINRQRSIEVNGKLIPYEENQDLIGQEVILDMNTGERLPARLISEGTMLTLGLLAVLMHPDGPNLVLLDDVEQGLHPKAQRELMDVLKEILRSNENLQIILSTHSPYIVDELKPSQVHVLNNTHGGFTVAKRLDEHPDIEWAKQALTTGEFWDAEGEEWVVGSENP
ncbi:MAG: ATP-binding protein [Cyanobacteriota bacterium]|nr:ATP-binding protein [Cyanobacteriota bacterium]